MGPLSLQEGVYQDGIFMITINQQVVWEMMMSGNRENDNKRRNDDSNNLNKEEFMIDHDKNNNNNNIPPSIDCKERLLIIKSYKI